MKNAEGGLEGGSPSSALSNLPVRKTGADSLATNGGHGQPTPKTPEGEPAAMTVSPQACDCRSPEQPGAR